MVYQACVRWNVGLMCTSACCSADGNEAQQPSGPCPTCCCAPAQHPAAVMHRCIALHSTASCCNALLYCNHPPQDASIHRAACAGQFCECCAQASPVLLAHKSVGLISPCLGLCCRCTAGGSQAGICTIFGSMGAIPPQAGGLQGEQRGH